jgi:hypothetical protein
MLGYLSKHNTICTTNFSYLIIVRDLLHYLSCYTNEKEFEEYYTIQNCTIIVTQKCHIAKLLDLSLDMLLKDINFARITKMIS